MKLESFLRWLSILLFTALAVWVTVPVLAMIQNAPLRRINPFYLYLITDLVLWFIVVRFLFQDFYARGTLFGGVKRFYELILAHPIQVIYSLFRRSLNTLTRRLVLAGVLVAGLVALATQVRQLEVIGWNILTRPFVPDRGTVRQTAQHTRYLSLLTGDNNRRDYLHACLKIANDLKKAGARVVVFELPGTPYTEEYLSLIAKIEATGIAVFGVRPYEGVWRFAPDPTAGKSSLTWGVFTHVERGLGDPPFIQRFKPYGYYRTYREKSTQDVALAAVRKFRGIGPDEPIVRDDRTIHTGLGTLTVDADGTLYSFQPAFYHRWNVPVLVDLNTDQKGLRYRLVPTGPFPSTKPIPSIEEIDSFLPVADEVRDKIILVPWLEWYGGPGKGEVFAYIPLIEQMLSDQMTRRLAAWDLFLAATLIAIGVALARWMRGLYAVPLMALAGVGAFYGCVWLADAQNILVNPAPAILAAMLSIAAFPLVRFAWTMRAAEPSLAPSLRAEPMPAGYTAEQPVAVSGKTATAGKRLSLSLRVAVAAMLILIAGSVGVTSLWLG
ncbi:MAG: hypothetical protein ACRDGA_11575, partial [Bacteroidota bacterium]